MVAKLSGVQKGNIYAHISEKSRDRLSRQVSADSQAMSLELWLSFSDAGSLCSLHKVTEVAPSGHPLGQPPQWTNHFRPGSSSSWESSEANYLAPGLGHLYIPITIPDTWCPNLWKTLTVWSLRVGSVPPKHELRVEEIGMSCYWKEKWTLAR